MASSIFTNGIVISGSAQAKFVAKVKEASRTEVITRVYQKYCNYLRQTHRP